MAILICGLGLWATLVLSARTLLSESYVNFPLVIVMGLALVLIFIVICSNFRSLLNEFSNLFYVSEVLLFGTIPILSSSIIAWFLCVEIPNLDLSFCFSSTYALYVLLLNSPRKSSHPSSYTSTSYERIFVHTLPKNILLVVYSLPLFIGPLLHTVVTHNVIFDSWSRVSGVVTSFLLPSILILTCAENHIAYWKKEESPVILKNISNTKLILSAILFFLIQNHPIFDDIRKISNLPSPIASAILCGIAMLSSLVVYLHKLILVQFKESKLDDSSSRESTVSTTSLYVFSSLAAGCCGALVPIFLGLPNTVCYIAFQGALCANNFYRYSSNYRWKSCFAFITNYPIPVAFMMVSTKMVFFTFAFKTVVLSVFTFDWEPMPMTMFYFTFWLDSMVQLAVFAPTVAMGINHFNDRKLSNSLPIGEQTQSEEGVAFWSVTMTQIRCLSFSLILVAFNYWMAIAELIVREQVRAYDILLLTCLYEYLRITPLELIFLSLCIY